MIEVEIQDIDVPTREDAARDLADRDLVERALVRLDPEHRALVVLHYYFGYPLPEAATSLGISLPAAKARLHRAMQRVLADRRRVRRPRDARMTGPARGATRG